MYACDRYNSMGDLVAYLREQQKLNPDAEVITRTTDPTFHGEGGTWDAALNWAERGDNRNLDKFADLTRQAQAKIARHVEKRFAPSFARSGAGSISMGRYMDGVPDCIVRMKPGRDQLRKGGNHERVIKIFVSCSCGGDVRGSEIEERGAYICGIVEALAAAGRKVELWVGGWAMNSSQSAALPMMMTCIKRAQDRLHVETARFALCNPAFNRRLRFGYIEFNAKALRKHFASVESKTLPASWSAPSMDKEMAREFSIIIPGMASQDSPFASYHIAKIEERLKTAGILH